MKIQIFSFTHFSLDHNVGGERKKIFYGLKIQIFVFLYSCLDHTVSETIFQQHFCLLFFCLFKATPAILRQQVVETAHSNNLIRRNFRIIPLR